MIIKNHKNHLYLKNMRFILLFVVSGCMTIYSQGLFLILFLGNTTKCPRDMRYIINILFSEFQIIQNDKEYLIMMKKHEYYSRRIIKLIGYLFVLVLKFI